MWFTNDFLLAIKDYYYLANRNYPARGFLKLVGDRYKLSNYQRAILYRGVISEKLVESRRLKMISANEIMGHEIWIDGFNVLLTIISYLQGYPAFVAMDGFLRDASQFRGRFPKPDLIEKSYQMLIKTLLVGNQGKTYLFLDENVKNSLNLESLFTKAHSGNKLNLEIAFCKKVDNILAEKCTGLICTSDTGIIDKTNCKVNDLARRVLVQHFTPEFVNLSAFLPSQ